MSNTKTKIKSWKDIPPKNVTYAKAMLEIEGIVNAEISTYNKTNKEMALYLTKCWHIIQRGF